jgi:LPXTG-site transpeptidase (sortase) family protein
MVLVAASLMSAGLLAAFLSQLTVRADMNALQPAVRVNGLLSNADIKTISPGQPLRVRVPRLSVDAKIDQMGLTKTGAMDTPDNIATAGWYKYGPSPGSVGSAVIVGHKTGFKGVPGVFNDLGKMQKGDSIEVIDDKNQSLRFTVRETKSYKWNDTPTEVFNSASGAHLNLITCTGSWDVNAKQFQHRLVVFADLQRN